jgi:single-strand DNA-binding protein
MINTVILQGRLVADPKASPSATISRCSFRLAWSNKVKGNDQKLFLSCVAWRHTAEFVQKYFQKGDPIAVEGQLMTKSWTGRDGTDRSSVELNVTSAHFCGSTTHQTGGASRPVTRGVDVPYELHDLEDIDDYGGTPFDDGLPF